MERSYKTREQISSRYCGGVFREKNFKDHLHRRHEGKERKYASSEVTKLSFIRNELFELRCEFLNYNINMLHNCE